MGLFGFFKKEEEETEDNMGNTIDDELGDISKDLLTEILDLMGFFNVVKVKKEDKEFISLEIKGDDLGRIIGKEGATLFALQVILKNILSKKYKRSIQVLIDANNYLEKREKLLKKIAYEAADKAIDSKEKVILKPMFPWERRIIHLTLQDSEFVRTESQGKSKERQVVVIPE